VSDLWENVSCPPVTATFTLMFGAIPVRINDAGGWPQFYLSDLINALGVDRDALVAFRDAPGPIMVDFEGAVRMFFDGAGNPACPFGAWLAGAIELSDLGITPEAAQRDFLRYRLVAVGDGEAIRLRQEIVFTPTGLAQAEDHLFCDTQKKAKSSRRQRKAPSGRSQTGFQRKATTSR
jgi:hypothetical protein